MKSFIKAFALIAIILGLSSFIWAGNEGENEPEVIELSMNGNLTIYSGLPILEDLGYSDNAGFGERIDEAINNVDVVNIIGLVKQLEFFEQSSGKKSAHVSVQGLVAQAADFITERKNYNEQEFDLVYNLAKQYELNDAIEPLEEYRRDKTTKKSGFGQWYGYAEVLVQNNSPYTCRVYIDGYYRGYLYSGNYDVWNVGAGWGRVKVVRSTGYYTYQDITLRAGQRYNCYVN